MAASRRQLLAAGAMAAGASASAAKAATPVTYVLCHGAWSAAWAWRKMRPLLDRPPESRFITPTYTGLGERAHLNSPEVTLDTHIADIVAVLEMEDLKDVTLIAHSYGGMVGTGVADRARARVRRLIYLDAFAPRNGESLYGLTGQTARPGGDWRVEPRGMPPDTSPEDVAWAAPRRKPQSEATFTTPLKLANPDGLPPRAYIRCARAAPGEDPLKASFERAKAGGWPTAEIDASHNPHITAPELLAKTLADLVSRT